MAEITIDYQGSMEYIIMNRLSLKDIETSVLGRIPLEVMAYINMEPGSVKIVVFDLRGQFRIEFDRGDD